MPQSGDDERLRTELISLNAREGGLIGWAALAAIVRMESVDSATRAKLRSSAAGRGLLQKLERALRRSEKRRSRAFLAHGFHTRDSQVVRDLRAALKKKRIAPVTGEKPSPGSVREKVLDRIDSTHVFVALFTADPQTDRPSPWIVSELGYAARKPRVVLLEDPLGKAEIGGIQGDVEYISFSREHHNLAFRKAAESAASRRERH